MELRLEAGDEVKHREGCQAGDSRNLSQDFLVDGDNKEKW